MGGGRAHRPPALRECIRLSILVTASSLLFPCLDIVFGCACRSGADAYTGLDGQQVARCLLVILCIASNIAGYANMGVLS